MKPQTRLRALAKSMLASRIERFRQSQLAAALNAKKKQPSRRERHLERLALAEFHREEFKALRPLIE